MTTARDGTEEALRLSGVEVFVSPESAEAGVRPILDGIDLTLRPGEWLNLVGVNGSGKSTLARLIAGLHVEAAYGQMSRGFAGDAASPVVLQRPEAQLFGETPREDIGFALEWRVADTAERISDISGGILRDAGLSEWADRRWEELSGGQRQLAAVAAALAVPAPLVVFDEATSMLDDANRRKLMRLAKERNRQGAAIVWVTQRLEEIEPDARVAAIAEGRIRYDGDGRTFFYGDGEGDSPCEACGLRLPYLAALAQAMKRTGRWSDPLPLSEEEWQSFFAAEHRPGASSVPGAGSEGAARRLKGLRLGTGRGKREPEDAAGMPIRDTAADEDSAVVRLEPGTMTLIVGPNGAGKTVFLEKTAGLRDPEGLNVEYGTNPLWKKRRLFPGSRLQGEVLPSYGLAAQSPEHALLERTLGREIEFSFKPYRRNGESGSPDSVAVDAALAAVGWDRTWLQRDPFLMSGGERRRAALAALFSTPAPWLLLDEPTAGLDREGHQQLGEHLKRLKRDGRGILLVSHDTDWALPLADRVLLIRPDGRMESLRPQELLERPDRLEAAGMDTPTWLKVASRIRRFAGLAPEVLWDPVRIAAEWDGRRSGEQPEGPGTASSNAGRKDSRPPAAARDEIRARAALLAEQRRRQRPLSRLSGFDPRAVWLGYALLSFGWFTLSSWEAILAGTAVSLLLLAAFRIPLRRWKSLIVGYASFGLILAALAASDLTWNAAYPVRWDAAAFAGTLLPFARTMAVLLIGLGLPLVMTPLSLRRALETLIPRQAKAQAIGQRIVLAVTLTVRFVPVLLGEWERFRRIFLARGKETSRSPIAAVRRLRGTAVPLLLALFRLADDVALALESRGVRKNVRPARSTRLRWGWKDATLVAGASGLAVLLHLFDECF
ncbi:ATP-binding cassette domain-containing protein [Cohnella caldifontis]|uniref:ATP-binding cassette domain-containing protein n=1 Tax=Cohnella caldifontis TaxID=3027471 RepID=UPI0023EC2D43|nr:ATP-binding cassette domain-containing protein [Cohnella sp. YIM B05605]